MCDRFHQCVRHELDSIGNVFEYNSNGRLGMVPKSLEDLVLWSVRYQAAPLFQETICPKALRNKPFVAEFVVTKLSVCFRFWFVMPSCELEVCVVGVRVTGELSPTWDEYALEYRRCTSFMTANPEKPLYWARVCAFPCSAPETWSMVSSTCSMVKLSFPSLGSRDIPFQGG